MIEPENGGMGDIVNDKSLEVLKMYDIEVLRVIRGRGGILINTEKGMKLFLECVHPDSYYKREALITGALSNCGFVRVDTYMCNTSGDVITQDTDGRKYILKNWYDGRECNIRDIYDVTDTVRTLAHMHKCLVVAAPYVKAGEEKLKEESATDDEDILFRKRAVEPLSAEHIGDAYVRHMKELKMARNYLKSKKKRQEFELLAYKSIGAFYDEAVRAVDIFDRKDIRERFLEIDDTFELCHGNFNYHNIILSAGEVCITSFDRVKKECQITDLYQFMRKLLEKYDWNIELAYKMIDEYDKVNPIRDTDLDILAGCFAFPEKFWKIINYYFNMNKAWIPPKSIDKLKTVVGQNDKRKEFIETLFA